MIHFRALLIILGTITFLPSINAQWSRNNETVRLTNGSDKIWIHDLAPIGGGTNRLYLTGDPGNYGNLLVHFQGDDVSSTQTLMRLGLTSTSSSAATILEGRRGSKKVFDFSGSGSLNLLDSTENFNRALDVRNEEALWYDGDQFSWGFGGNWNRFADPITIGGATPAPSGTALLITGGNDIRMDGGGARRIRFHQGLLEEGFVGYSGSVLTIQNNTGEYVQIRSNGRDQLFIGEDASLFGDLNMTGGINGISDRRTKRNILPISSALSSVLALQGQTYEFRREEFPELDLPEGKQYGLVAQEVEEILPDIVSNHSSVSLNGETITLKGIEYQALIPLLIESIKEQNKIIENLQLRIQLLEDSGVNISDHKSR